MTDRAIEAREQHPLRRYSNVAAAFHWVTVVLVLLQAYLGFTFSDAPDGLARDNIFVWHKTVGALILFVVLARLAYRLVNTPPPYPPELPAWERFAGTWNHRIFYLLLIAMPIVGFVSVSGFANGPTTPLLGGINIPVIPGISKQTGELAGEVHSIAAFLLVALIVLHIAAALKHEFIDKNRAAGRMPPFKDPVDEPVVVGQGSNAR